MFKIPNEDITSLNSVSNRPRAILFILAGIEGNCDVFKELSSSLEIFNIQIYGLTYSLKVPNDSIVSIARFYLGIIKQKLKELNQHTFTLGCYSFGGI